MCRTFLAVLIFPALIAIAQAAPDQPIFYASYDASFDADTAAGDPKAIVAGAPTLVEGRTGKAVLLDDDADIVSYAVKDNLNLSSGTVALWFKPVAPLAQRTHWDRLFDMHATTGNQNAIRILTKKDAAGLYAVIESSNTRASTMPDDSTLWTAPGWRHVALTWGAGWMRFYVDGVQRAFAFGFKPPDQTDSVFYVGNAKEKNASAKGAIDDLTIYDRPLPAAAIRALAGLTEASAPQAANLLGNSSFETGYAPYIVWWQGDLGTTWKVDDTNAGHGARSLLIDRTSARGPGIHRFVVHGPWLPLDAGDTATFSLYAKASAPGAKLRLKIQNGTKQNLLEDGAVDSKGIEKIVELTTEWQRYEVSGELPPAYKSAYRVNVHADSSGHKLWIDALQFALGGPREYVPAAPVELGVELDRFGNLYDVGETAQLIATVARYDKTPLKGELRCRLVDPLGGEVFAKSQPVATDKTGLARAVFEAPRLALRGQYQAEFDCRGPETPLRETLAFGVVRSHLGQPSPADSPFGVDAANQNMEFKIPRLRAIGVRHVRQGIGLSWSSVEPKQGQFDFGFDPEFLRLYHDAGVSCLPMLGFPPAWAAQKRDKAYNWRQNRVPPANLDEWINYVRTVVEQFKDKQNMWAIWNEPNGQSFYDGTTDEFAQLLLTAYKTIKSVQPESIVVGCSLAGSTEKTREWIDKVFAAGGLDGMDMLAFHPYKPGPPEDPEIHFVDDLRAMKAVMQKHGQVKPFCFTEFGTAGVEDKRPFIPWFSGPGGLAWDELDQARFLVRTMVLALAENARRLYWYQWNSERSGVGPDLQALIRPDAYYTPKKAVLAYNALIWQLEAAAYAHSLKLPTADQYGVAFKRADGMVTVLWDWRGESQVTLKGADGGAKLSDIWGNPLALDHAGGAVKLNLGPSPVYLETAGPLTTQ